MRRHLVVFVRLPVLGAVKRRLARDIGAVAAVGFYRRTTASVVARLARDRRWSTVLAVTPDRAVTAAPPAWRGCRRERQGPGDLGRRMARALRRHAPDPVVVVGSDIPGITARHVATAFRALGHAELVIGPAEDGGYWLIGSRDGRRLFRPFAGVRWSGPHALADTVASLRGRRIAIVARLADVDDGADFEAARKRPIRPCGAR
ncbi:MAG: glycosyltransferase [Alphaproteobacteria bacterium]|nr:glycosyltransferase [Alphaproteobacteria bacterium]